MYIIVGIDPGTTFALAAIDLRGNVIGTWSGRDAGWAGTLAQVRNFGMPCAFATDVSKAPPAVTKLAAYANARLFTPLRDLGQKEKSEITRNAKYSNEHESDALAAALFAYRHFENKLRLIDRVAEERGIPEKADEIKRLALGGLSVHTALLLLEEEKADAAPKDSRAPASKPAAAPRARGELVSEISSLAGSNAELRKAVERLERDNAELRERLALAEKPSHNSLVRDREIRYRDRLIHHLKQLLDVRRRKKKGSSQQGGGQPPRQQSKPQASGMNDLKVQQAKENSLDIENMVEHYRRR